MRIVVLDGYTTNPGDLCWDKLKELGECTIYDRTAPGEVLERAAGAEAILTNKVVINSETMTALPDLKYIARSEIHRRDGYRLQRGRHQRRP